MENKELVPLQRDALKAMKNAHSPYSKYRVGAALLTGTGRVFTGCNIENASYGLTICAERVAIFKAVSEGERRFQAMAIVTNGAKIATPCGACLQVMAEFAPQLTLILSNKSGKTITYQLKGLLPFPFNGSHHPVREW